MTSDKHISLVGRNLQSIPVEVRFIMEGEIRVHLHIIWLVDVVPNRWQEGFPIVRV